MTTTRAPTSWWRDAVCYEIYVRSFADGNGDGVGDLPGVRSRLPYVAALGIDAIWLTPFYRSPMVDHGYDVADHRAVDPLFGSLADFDAVVADAHALGLRVVVDLVPNHTSSDHPWFRRALADAASDERKRYVFACGRGDAPPNNWRSVFGGSAWSRVPDGAWYLHLFAPEQPDLDWRHPAVEADVESTIRFWLDRGVDGFRVDVAHGLFKDADLRDNPVPVQDGAGSLVGMQQVHTFDQDEVHDVYRRWRRLVSREYSHDPVLVGEVFLWEPRRVSRYCRPDELHLAFNFFFMGQAWDADGYRSVIEQSTTSMNAVGAACTWVLSNHDVARHTTRFGGGAAGRRRARAALLLMLGLPGAAFLYSGEELGLEDVDVPAAARQDPIFRRTNGARAGRDGCRVPLPWTRDAVGANGFSPAGAGAPPWLPVPPGWGTWSVEAQHDDDGSMLAFYRRALASRRAMPWPRGGGDGIEWVDAPAGVVCFRRGNAVVAVNCSPHTRRVAVDGDVVIASDAGVRTSSGRLQLPADSAAWLTT